MHSPNEPSKENRQEKLLAARKVIEDNPENVASWVQLGLLLAQYGDKHGAIRAFDKALEIDPENKYARARRDMLATHPDAVQQLKHNYAFASASEIRSNRWIVRIVFTVAVSIVLILILKFVLFSSTKRIVVNDDNNSFPVFSADGKQFGYSSILGNPMYFRSFTGGRFYVADRPGARSTPFDPDGKPSQDDKDSQFCFSHDAAWVAFVRTTGGQHAVCVARRDGSDFQPLGDGYNPKWSPVSHQLAFIGPDSTDSKHYAGSDSLILVDIQSKTRIDLTDSVFEYFGWSPTGGAIVFVDESQAHDGSDSEAYQVPDEQETDPFQTGDDTYVSPYHIAVIDVMTRTITELSKTGNHMMPVWLPDGSGIIYSTVVSQYAEIHLTSIDGSKDRVLYDAGSKIYTPGNLAISSDSKWIAFEAIATGDSVSESVVVPDAYRGFTGSPTARSERDYTPDIFVARTDGSDCHRLANLHDSKSNPCFRPGTRWLAYHTIPLGGKVQIWETKVK